MNEVLLAQIIRQVLSDPAMQSLLGNSQRVEMKSKRLVLLEADVAVSDVLQSVQAKWGQDHEIRFFYPGSTSGILLPQGVSWVKATDARRETDWQSVILPVCSPGLLAKIALGLLDDPISEHIAWAIRQGISVEIMKAELGFTMKTPQPYRQLYERYLQQVQEYGVIVHECVDGLPRASSLENFTGFKPQAEVHAAMEHWGPMTSEGRDDSKIIFDKKYLSEKEAFSIPLNASVVITKKTVVSPLAKDVLKMRKIHVWRDGEVFL